MQDKMDKLVKHVYKKYKADVHVYENEHPGEERLASFLEGGLSKDESEHVKAHLLSCSDCMDNFASNFPVFPIEKLDVPAAGLAELKELILAQKKVSFLEIALRLKEKMLEVINTNGDCLVGLELIPAPVLRSREIKDFKDEVVILKDFGDIRVEVKVENKDKNTFNLIIVAKNRQTQQVLKDLRITLIKDGLEMESCLANSGSVVFEHVELGVYKVEVSSIEERLASILLDVKA
ncbi:MAG: zf-HC2 domain-containing protein [Candidatus Omnitrophica bacterium]|nr:zf-HC2 domain-containing protein [Candidatus Omnitrophota bacterium]